MNDTTTTTTTTNHNAMMMDPPTDDTTTTTTKSQIHSNTMKSLKDLNVADTKQLSSVLYGRKASTFLGIFRDTDTLTTKNNEIEQMKQTSTTHDSSIKNKDILIEQSSDKKSMSSSSQVKTSRRRAMSRIDDSLRISPILTHPTLATNIIPTATATSNRSSSQHRGRHNSRHRSLSNHSDLTLKPVSSATYYPHKSKTNPNSKDDASQDDINVDMDDHNNNNNIDRSNHIDNVIEGTSLQNSISIKNDDNTAILPSNLTANVQLNNVNQDQNNNLMDKHPKINNDLIVNEQNDINMDKIDNQEEAIDDADDNDYDEEDDEEDDDKEYPLAVELKPFTNKVGGHTAIFRFSKRAVCKALVKRENRWYETMEQTNNKLLKFMPRYIGVLNVRQHFSSKEDFLSQIPTTNKATETKETPLEAQSTGDNLMGAPLHHVHSIVTSSPHRVLENPNRGIPSLSRTMSSASGYDCSFPEVVIDDNKHIMPDSLWDRYAQSSDSNSRRESFSEKQGNGFRNSDSGYTTINTKLKDLILQEVFAPVHNVKGHENKFNKRSACETPTRTVSGKYMKKKSRSSSSSSSSSSQGARALRSSLRRDSIFSLKDDQVSTSPLMNKSTKDTISNAIDSSHSMMDLEQFHKKASARENADNIEDEQYTRRHIHSHSHSNCKGGTRRNSRHRHSIDEGCPIQDSSNGRSEHPEDNNNNNVDSGPLSESISFEENTDTIVSKFILLEDLTRHMTKPCVLDLKMGTRQYGVDAAPTKQRSQRNKCLKTTSRKLGVRVCGLKVWDTDYYIKKDKYFGRRVRIGWQFVRTLARFLYDGESVKSIVRLIPRLVKEIDQLALEVSNLKGFRLYGASLLLMYEGDKQELNNQSVDGTKKMVKIKVNLIDFAKCVTREDLEEGINNNTFAVPPRYPSSIDQGFYRGLKSLKFYLMILWSYLTIDEPMVTNEKDLRNLLDEKAELFEKSWDWLDEFDKENEQEFNDPESELRTKWRKYELIFDVEPRYNNNEEVSD
ncbi:inositol polyphosphate kinase KCS1 [Maudiozyma barnettii]|uniref:Kinase n=1 Tax=Maudiozyma barnettii TaxID=61262 RepID=A0A8H2VD87_9SACH|nr:inositol polyphosphate kinase KCS1 [Kazachstania barnettii]CAB4253142.1 similar to Saccharomyces cerevisiae YDR017C KCS1 Inositol hexakisphosphate (IP6) and inositol heptakisphosphate (IP7) kinase [Kazachstania barnettii]